MGGTELASRAAVRAAAIGAAGLVAWLAAGSPIRAAGSPPAPPDEPGGPARERAARRADEPPVGAAREFRTDFSRHTVPYDQILSGGPPKDGIPAIDRPRFIDVAEADGWLQPMEPVILLEIGGDARGYPLQVVTWHEIVNDTVGGVPVSVTFCPLCNTAIAFERTVEGRRLDFGTTGRLRYSNLIMYDRQTESWWQQATGEAIAGALAGKRLVSRPAPIVAWRDFKARHPGGRALSRRTGHVRSYGRNPYVGYDDVRGSPFLYDGPSTPGRLAPMARVLTVEIDGEAVAYPYEILRESRVVNDTVAGEEIVVLWTPGTASALDAASVAGGRDVGTAIAYLRTVGDRTLTFARDGGRLIDRETLSEWSASGRAIAGEMAGRALTPAVAINHFWFSWAAFRPSTRVYRSDQ
ncbi:MAG: DUF3179 domain-containing protein [Acidobacteriota bacterium]